MNYTAKDTELIEKALRAAAHGWRSDAVMIRPGASYKNLAERAEKLLQRIEASKSRGPKIEAVREYMQTHKQGMLRPTLAMSTITARLGVYPTISPDGDGGKVALQWTFTVDGVPCSIWDYKGVQWSTFGPRDVFRDLFPGMVDDGSVAP